MSGFNDPNEPPEWSSMTRHEETEFRTADQTGYWITRNGDSIRGHSVNDGTLGYYNESADMTTDHNGTFVGWGNWLPSLFGKK